jgi:hypothetical protein
MDITLDQVGTHLLMLLFFLRALLIQRRGPDGIARRTACEARKLGGLRHGVSLPKDCPWRSPPSCRIHTPERARRSARPTDPHCQCGSSFRRSVVPLIGLTTSQRALGAATLRSTRSSLPLAHLPRVLGDEETAGPARGPRPGMSESE